MASDGVVTLKLAAVGIWYFIESGRGGALRWLGTIIEATKMGNVNNAASFFGGASYQLYNHT